MLDNVCKSIILAYQKIYEHDNQTVFIALAFPQGQRAIDRFGTCTISDDTVCSGFNGSRY